MLGVELTCPLTLILPPSPNSPTQTELRARHLRSTHCPVYEYVGGGVYQLVTPGGGGGGGGAGPSAKY